MPGARITASACLRALAVRLHDRVEQPHREAERLLAHASNRPRSWLYSHGGTVLDEAIHTRVWELLQRRINGEPMAYLLGTQDFRRLQLRVDPAVLIPRPETEELVDHALACLRASAPCEAAPLTVLDLGTGSGAIALALADEASPVRVVAVDRSASVLACARDNGQRLGLAVDWRAGDWFGPVQGERFHLIVANPPYIAEGDPHLGQGDLRHEPVGALVSGRDGLNALRIIIRGAPAHLHPGGWLVLEHGYDQARAVGQELALAGFTRIEQHHDLGGRPRIALGRWQPGPSPESGEAHAHER